MSRDHFDIRKLDTVERSSLPADGGADYNRLIFSRSPYLLQHATNPVDWFPWGEEAFVKARQEDKPVFLSIGYSTCHWCHVMADESFADPTVAEILRRGFVAIKVDREERPDIDNQYMNACQLMTGSGGWPLTLVLTPDQRPFFAATYIPRESRQGMYGLIDLLERIITLWQEKRADLVESGDRLTAALRNLDDRPESVAEVDDTALRKALAGYRQNFDARAGGFGDAPKFPAPHNLSLLFRLGRRFDAVDAIDMATTTLARIRNGGVYDQVGFGLHRYAVDSDWQVPHFEKMLYDQALFMLAALDAWQVTRDQAYADMVDNTAEYLLRDLQAPDGGFYAGEDADSEGAEGTFYLWTPDQVNAVLGADVGELFCKAYGITPAGNFEGRSIPHRAIPPAELAAAEDLAKESLQARLETGRRQLLAARGARVRPHRDDKILTAWNGLVIAALARSGAVLDRPEWVAAAERATEFLFTNLVEGGRLLRSWREGPADIPAFAEDYAALSWGLFELYQAGFAPRYLEACHHWVKESLRLFGDGEGDLWDVGLDAEQVIGRGRSLVDGAAPAAGSILAVTMLRLADVTGDAELRQQAVDLVRSRLARATPQPTAFAQLLSAVDYLLGPAQQLVVCAPSATEPVDEFFREARRRFLPGLVSLLWTPDRTALTDLTDLLKGRTAETGVTAYLCRERTCRAPIRRPSELAAEFDRP